MYCPNCGNQVQAGAKFCAHCGSALAPVQGTANRAGSASAQQRPSSARPQQTTPPVRPQQSTAYTQAPQQRQEKKGGAGKVVGIILMIFSALSLVGNIGNGFFLSFSGLTLLTLALTIGIFALGLHLYKKATR